MLFRLAKVRVQDAETGSNVVLRHRGGQREIKLMEEAYFKCQSSQATVYPRNLAETSGSLTNCTSGTSRTRIRSTPSGGRFSSLSIPPTAFPPTEHPQPL